MCSKGNTEFPAKYADIILHVVDISNPDATSHMQVVYDTLKQLGVEDKVVITAFNKIDKLEEDMVIKDLRADKTLKISAKSNINLDSLLDMIETILRESKVLLEKVFPYSEAGKIQIIRKNGQMLLEEYQQDGIFVRAYVPKAYESL